MNGLPPLHPAPRAPAAAVGLKAPPPDPVPGAGEVIVVGAGPVGLLLGCCLARSRVPFVVLERDLEPSPHSRAIGIHPPSLELLAELDLVEPFRKLGVEVTGGVAIGDGGRLLGRLAFDTLPGPYRFALSLPQQVTEELLERRLQELAPGSLRRGLTVERVAPAAPGGPVMAAGRDASGRAFSLRGRFLVGCDGKGSLVRQAADIPFLGRPYPDAYIMGDFPDNTGFGAEARLFLTARGLVESFPLPGGLRRWVASTPGFQHAPTPEDLRDLVLHRTGHDLAGLPSSMLSPFGIQRYQAASFVQGALALAGDAAHVVSPIGGQGMNAGWLDARDLAHALAGILHQGRDPREALARYDREARQRAARVIRRATFNTYMGRATRLPTLRAALVWTLLHTPARQRLARVFTMRGL